MDEGVRNRDLHPVHQMTIKEAFQGLTAKEKRYARLMSRAAWHGARIIMRQVSEEAIGIFDFTMELYNSCSGDWAQLAKRAEVDATNIEEFITYAATFLSNVGNYYGRGDHKFVPDVGPEIIEKLAAGSAKATDLCNDILKPMLSKPPYSLGDEIALISRQLEQYHIFPENTRIQKNHQDGKIIYNVLQASIENSSVVQEWPIDGSDSIIRVVPGDHSGELSRICEELSKAMEFTANSRQNIFISQYVKSFQTGDLEQYRESQRTWVRNRAPTVENIFGFVEPFRDPFGIRAEFEALVAISNAKETMMLSKLVENSNTFIQRLPWAVGCTENNGKGPFEKSLFEPPDFASIHTLAYCSTIIFSGINLPNYNDIRQECGFKNVMIANQLSARTQSNKRSPFLDESDNEAYQKHKHHPSYLWIVLHELLGHGTGRMMVEENEEKYNFDITSPPINLLSTPSAPTNKTSQNICY